MKLNQIYEIVNSVVQQATGNKELTVVNEKDLISLGDNEFSSNENKELFQNAMVQRIGKVIISRRLYKGNNIDLLIDDFKYGAIVQKLSVGLLSAEKDEAYELQDGQSVDQWKVNKPKVLQKLFVTETPYKFHISIAEDLLNEAFESAIKMGNYIEAIYGALENSQLLALENLKRTALANAIAEVHGTSREINLLTRYKTDTGSTLTADKAKNDADFLRYCTEQINLFSDNFREYNKGLYNDGTIERFTPKENQKIILNNTWARRLESKLYGNTYHDSYVKLKGYQTIAHWQSIKTPTDIKVIRASENDSAETDVKGIVGMMFDEEAIGIYKKYRKVVSTGLNASGLYYNIYSHQKDMYFNDLSENIVTFIVADA